MGKLDQKKLNTKFNNGITISMTIRGKCHQEIVTDLYRDPYHKTTSWCEVGWLKEYNKKTETHLHFYRCLLTTLFGFDNFFSVPTQFFLVWLWSPSYQGNWLEKNKFKLIKYWTQWMLITANFK